MNEKVEIQIGSRRLSVEIEGLIPIEISALAEKVSARMAEMQLRHKTVADTSKLSLLVALSFAAELEQERRAHDTTRHMLENFVQKMSRSLRESLAADGPAESPA